MSTSSSELSRPGVKPPRQPWEAGKIRLAIAAGVVFVTSWVLLIAAFPINHQLGLTDSARLGSSVFWSMWASSALLQGLSTFLFVRVFLWDRRRRLARSVPARAEVVGIATSGVRGQVNYAERPTVRFTASDHLERTIEVAVPFKGSKVGDTLDARYDPVDPAWIVLGDANARQIRWLTIGMTALMGGLAVPCAVVAAYTWTHGSSLPRTAAPIHHAASSSDGPHGWGVFAFGLVFASISGFVLWDALRRYRSFQAHLVDAVRTTATVVQLDKGEKRTVQPTFTFDARGDWITTRPPLQFKRRSEKRLLTVGKTVEIVYDPAQPSWAIPAWYQPRRILLGNAWMLLGVAMGILFMVTA
jgi:hypothetical protein